MNATSSISQYQQIAVRTVTPERMIVMLYEGFYRFVGQARKAHAEGDVKTRCIATGKAKTIVNELEHALDHEAGADVSRDLASLYRFCSHELTEFAIDHDHKHLDHVERVMKPLLEAWRAIPVQTESSPRSPDLDALEDSSIANVGTQPASASPTGTAQASPGGAVPESAETHKANFCAAV